VISLSLSAWLKTLKDQLVVPTVPVRRSDYEERIREFVESLAGSSRAGLCIVAGNPHYLSEEEAARRAGPLLMEAAALSRARLGDLPIMVGTENVESAALKCCMRHRCMPFFLLDDGVENVVERYRSISSTCRWRSMRRSLSAMALAARLRRR